MCHIKGYCERGDVTYSERVNLSVSYTGDTHNFYNSCSSMSPFLCPTDAFRRLRLTCLRHYTPSMAIVIDMYFPFSPSLLHLFRFLLFFFSFESKTFDNASLLMGIRSHVFRLLLSVVAQTNGAHLMEL